MGVVERVREKAEGIFDGANGCHNLEHTIRVFNLAIHIGKIEGADLEVLSVAALLHDIAREQEMNSKGGVCHAEIGAKQARELLVGEFSLDDGFADKVVHCIETHRSRKGNVPESIEAKVLFDADKLDSLGATGIGRIFMFAARYGANFHDKDIDFENVAPYSKEDTAYCEFNVKLKTIKDKMFTVEGKRIAQRRHDFMCKFFDELNAEVDGDV